MHWLAFLFCTCYIQLSMFSLAGALSFLLALQVELFILAQLVGMSPVMLRRGSRQTMSTVNILILFRILYALLASVVLCIEFSDIHGNNYSMILQGFALNIVIIYLF